MSNATQTVGTETQTDSEKKAGRPSKPEFDIATAQDAQGNPIPRNDEGKLQAVPMNWSSSFSSLKRGDFATKVLFLEFRVRMEDLKIEACNARKQELVELIKEETTPLTPEQKAAKDIARMEKKIAELRAIVAAAGN